MQKYTNGVDFRYFEDEVDVRDWINLEEYRPMTEQEIEQHENPKTALTDVQKEQLPALTKRQFSLYVYDNNLTDKVEDLFVGNPRAKIEFDSAGFIERLNPTVLLMSQALGWSTQQVDAMWMQASTL